jgi:hypothetical protein
MNTTHKSDSSEQQAAEIEMLRLLETTLGLQFDSNATLPIDVGVQPDAIDVKNKTVVEAYARIGAVKGAQLHKIKGDILKLALIGRRLGDDWRKIFCFASNEAAGYASGNSWVAEAAREFGIEVVVVEIPANVRESVVHAQSRQRMVNPE